MNPSPFLLEGGVGQAMVCFRLSLVELVAHNRNRIQTRIGLSKAVDCWCADMHEDPDFMSGAARLNESVCSEQKVAIRRPNHQLLSN